MAVLTFVMQSQTPTPLETKAPTEQDRTSPRRLTPLSSSKAIEAIGDLQSSFHNKASRRWAIEDLVSAYGFNHQNPQDTTTHDILELRYSKHFVACLKVDRVFSRSSASVAYLDLGGPREFQEKPTSRKWNEVFGKISGNMQLPAVKKQLARAQPSEQHYHPFIPAILMALAQGFRNKPNKKNGQINVHVLTAAHSCPKNLRSYSARVPAASLESFDGLFQMHKAEPLEILCREIPLWPASKAMVMLSKIFDDYEGVEEGQYTNETTNPKEMKAGHDAMSSSSKTI